FAPLFIKTPKINGFMSGAIRINDPFGKPFVEFDTKTEEFRFENDSIGILSTAGEYLSGPGNIQIHAVSDNRLYNFMADFGYRPKDSSENQLNGTIVL